MRIEDLDRVAAIFDQAERSTRDAQRLAYEAKLALDVRGPSAAVTGGKE